MKGITTRDVDHFNPRTNSRGVIKQGTEVYQVNHHDWSGQWVVKHRRDAPHMNHWDWQYSYVEVPDDAVQVMKEEADGK